MEVETGPNSFLNSSLGITKIQERGGLNIDQEYSFKNTCEKSRSFEETKNTRKRKASNSELDLNLSLKVPEKIDEELDSSLSLSLSHSYPSLELMNGSNNEEEEGRKKHGKIRASTLDLTL